MDSNRIQEFIGGRDLGDGQFFVLREQRGRTQLQLVQVDYWEEPIFDRVVIRGGGGAQQYPGHHDLGELSCELSGVTEMIIFQKCQDLLPPL